ncbi:uncharacterized protein LOC130668353 [Microplitis mediator]|uniref:uncharacterized protein LOC130668353 n=1 Tax=Microplitis mediator TaxID=375433 RepID=UPI0025545A7C|nr:uncharacterized protein LOC130668353 [Microplitis mediator]
MKLLVFTVVVIVLFSFSPSGKANAFNWKCWNTIVSSLITPDILCHKCTNHQICLSEEKNEWKCEANNYAGCSVLQTSGGSSLYPIFDCNKPNIEAFYKIDGKYHYYSSHSVRNNIWDCIFSSE